MPGKKALQDHGERGLRARCAGLKGSRVVAIKNVSWRSTEYISKRLNLGGIDVHANVAQDKDTYYYSYYS